MGDLADLSVRLDTLLRGVESPRVLNAAGLAGKRAALEVANEITGGDGRLSGWRNVKLNAGYDLDGPHSVRINLRPAGIWLTMQRGRKGGRKVTPRRRGRRGKKALSTPFGPRTAITLGPTRGTDAIVKAHTRARPAVVRAAANEIRQIRLEVL